MRHAAGRRWHEVMMQFLQDLLTILMVLGAQVAVFLLPPWWVARRWLAPGPWPLTALAALTCGWAAQMAMGLSWGRYVRGAAAGEVWYYLGLCALLTGAMLAFPRRHPTPSAERMPATESALLIVVLLVAVAIRSLYPLQHFALGQSDAYTHLTMVRQVQAWGFLGNATYPPGFAWVQHLPAALFGFDVYHLARFGGAFFGTALTLAIWALLRHAGGRAAALAGAALIAGCPALLLLLKTGVGAFANQVGFVMLPVLALGWLRLRDPATRWSGAGWLILTLFVLTVAVPMMLLHTLLLLALWILLDGAWDRRAWQRRCAGLTLLALGGAALLVLYLATMSPWHRAVTMSILTTADQTLAWAKFAPEKTTSAMALVMLVGDFFGVKRFGFHIPLFDAAFVGLLAAFATCLVVGLRRSRSPLIVIGAWGLLAVVQTGTGWLQFTAYQREGWSLLIAISALGGLMVASLWTWRAWIRPFLIAGLTLGAVWTLWHPPTHPLLNSSAEEELIRAARLLRDYPHWAAPSDPDNATLRGFLMREIDPNVKLKVVTRSLIQGGMLPAVAGFNPLVVYPKIAWDHPLTEYLAHGGQFLIFFDAPEDAEQHAFGIFGSISPELRRNFIEQQHKRYATNQEMEQTLHILAHSRWHVAEQVVTPKLRAVVVRSLTP